MSLLPLAGRMVREVLAARGAGGGGMACPGALGAGTFGQLTLWSGRSGIVGALLGYMMDEAWPAGTHFRWCVSDQMAEREVCLQLLPAARELMARGHTVEMWQAPGAGTHDNGDVARHEHVARLYREAFRRAAQDDYFLTIEDDNLPPPRVLAQLAQHARPDRAQIGAVYRIRGAPMYLNCSLSLEDPWRVPLADECPRGVFITPMMGAGYTLYLGSAMRRIDPVQCRVRMAPGKAEPHVAGWDDWVGREFARLGYSSVSDGSLWVGHHTPEVQAHLAHLGLIK